MMLSGTLDAAFTGIQTESGADSKEFAASMCGNFLQDCAQTLGFMLNDEHHAAFLKMPLRPLCLLLELFVDYCPLVSENGLEMVMPFAFRQTCREMIAAGYITGESTVKRLDHAHAHSQAGGVSSEYASKAGPGPGPGPGATPIAATPQLSVRRPSERQPATTE